MPEGEEKGATKLNLPKVTKHNSASHRRVFFPFLPFLVRIKIFIDIKLYRYIDINLIAYAHRLLARMLVAAFSRASV